MFLKHKRGNKAKEATMPVRSNIPRLENLAECDSCGGIFLMWTMKTGKPEVRHGYRSGSYVYTPEYCKRCAKEMEEKDERNKTIQG